MNVLVTDVKAPTAPAAKSTATTPAESTPAADKTSDAGKKDFRSMMQENNRSESKNKLQLVENTSNNKVSGDSIEGAELSLEDGLAPDVLLEHLGVSDIEVIAEAPAMIQPVDEIASFGEQ